MDGANMQAMLLEFLMDQGEPLSPTGNDQPQGQQSGSGLRSSASFQPVSSSNTHTQQQQQQQQQQLHQPDEPFPAMRRSVNGGNASFPAWTLPSITTPPNSSPVFAPLTTPSLLPWSSSAPPIFRQSSREDQDRNYNMPSPAENPWSCSTTPCAAPYISQPYQVPNECFNSLPGGGFGGADYSQSAQYFPSANLTKWDSQNNQHTLQAHRSLPTHLPNTSPPATNSGVRNTPAPSSTPVHSHVQRNVRAKQRSQEHQLEAQLQAKLSELGILQAQSSALQKKLNVLEAVVPVRDLSLAFLTNAAAIMKAPQPKWGAPHIVPSQISLAFSVFLPTNWDSPAALETIRATTPVEFRSLWRSFLRETAFLVLAAEAHGVVSEAHDRLAMLVLQAMNVFDKIILLAPDSFSGSMYVHLETGEPAAPDESFWRSVASALAPSEKQLHHLQNAVEHYQSNEISRVSERSNLTDMLVRTLGESLPSSGAIFRAEFHNEVEELTTLLKRNLLQERAAQCTMADYLSSLVLTPLQVVKMAAVSYPYFPDGVAITHACVQLAAEHGQGKKGDGLLDHNSRAAVSVDVAANSGTGKRCVVASATSSD